jgi:pyridoxine 5-phosphate synthase
MKKNKILQIVNTVQFSQIKAAAPEGDRGLPPVSRRETERGENAELAKLNGIHLGVNIDHIATLRQARGGTTAYPNLVEHAKSALKAGASQITIHLREDRRHIQLQDLIDLSKARVPLNLEMAATQEMERLAIKYHPAWVCLVPEKRQELTTEGGLDVDKISRRLSPMIKRIKKHRIKVSLFIDPSLKQVNKAHDLGADAVEFHTGTWVLAKGSQKKQEWSHLYEAAVLADELGLRVHAGHGLDYKTAHEIRHLPHLQEVNIGHSLVCYSLEKGLSVAIQKMKRQLL